MWGIWALVAFAMAAEALPKEDFARQICSAKTSELEALIVNAPPGCERTRLLALLKRYHPGYRAGGGAVAAQEVSAAAKSLKVDLGPSESWKASPQTDALRKRAFGPTECPAAIARFRKDDAALSFVATTHLRIEADQKAAVFSAIEAEFRALSPEVVVVEGFPEEFSCDTAVRLCMTDRNEITTEPEFLAKLAIDAGKPVVGGEPEDLGLPPKDALFFGTLRGLLTRRGQPIHQAFQESIGDLRGVEGYTLQNFLDHYRALNGRSLQPANFVDDFTPSYNLIKSGGRARGTNRLVDRVDVARDHHILKVLRKNLLSAGRVLVVYGRDHLPRQLPAYENAFGRSKGPAALCPPLPSPLVPPPKNPCK